MPFAARNAFALDIDYQEEPPMFAVSDTHFAATWLLDERAPKSNPSFTNIETMGKMVKDEGEIR